MRDVTSAQGPAAIGMPVAEVRAAAREFLRLHRFPVKVEVFARQEDFLGEQATQQNEGRIVGTFYRTTRTIKLAAASMRDRSDVLRALRHETIGHFGALCLHSEDKRALLEKLKAVRGKPDGLGAIWRHVERNWPPPVPLKEMPERQRAHFDDVLAEEVFAVAAEEPQPSRLGGAWIQVKAIAIRGLRKVGLVDDEVTLAEVQALIGSLARGMRNGSLKQRIFPRHDGALFSRQDERVFMSGLTAAVERGHGAPREAFGAQWVEWLDGAQRRGEIKQAERAWSGLDQWILEQRGPVGRNQLGAYVREHQIDVGEVVFGNDVVASRLTPDEEAELTDLYLRERVDPESLTDDEAARLSALEERGERVVSFGAATTYDQYQLPGGRGYRELVLTLSTRRPEAMSAVVCEGDRVCVRGEWMSWESATERYLDTASASGFRKTVAKFDEAMRELLVEDVLVPELRLALGALQRDPAVFSESHFAADNVIAHVRFNERTAVDGRRLIHVEEIQSDWAQLGRARGFATGDGGRAQLIAGHDVLSAKIAALDGDGEAKEALIAERDAMAQALNEVPVPSTPFKRTEDWVMLAMKRVVRWAAERGFDAVTWTTGKTQEERFDLGKQVAEIRAEGDGPYYNVTARDGSGNVVLNETMVTAKRLGGLVGKELAEKIVTNHGGRFVGRDLKVGGEGMRAFYDGIVPATVGAWARRLGGGVSKTFVPREPVDLDRLAQSEFEARFSELSTRGQAQVRALAEDAVRRDAVAVHCLDITDDMRSVVMQAMPLFRREAAPAEVRVVFRTDSAAFEDVGMEGEVAQVLRQAGAMVGAGTHGPLLDTNGEVVGCVEAHVEDGVLPAGHVEFRLRVPVELAADAPSAIEAVASSIARGDRRVAIVGKGGWAFGEAIRSAQAEKARACALDERDAADVCPVG